MEHKEIFVFDIETVTDLEAARNLLGDDIAEEELKIRLEEYHLSITKNNNSFIRQPFHKVVAISFLRAEIERTAEGEIYHIAEVRSGESTEEKQLVAGFFDYLKNKYARLVTFNGRTFDLPVLKYRAMLHGVAPSWLYKRGDKWNSYNSRYSLDWHCDLLEAFSDFGASARVKMQEVCAMLGLPGKLEVDGSMVEELYNQGKIAAIKDYCELDVLNTYLLYLRYMYHIGTLQKANYNSCVEKLIEFLQSSCPEKKINYHQFYEELNNKSRNLIIY